MIKPYIYNLYFPQTEGVYILLLNQASPVIPFDPVINFQDGRQHDESRKAAKCHDSGQGISHSADSDPGIETCVGAAPDCTDYGKPKGCRHIKEAQAVSFIKAVDRKCSSALFTITTAFHGIRCFNRIFQSPGDQYGEYGNAMLNPCDKASLVRAASYGFLCVRYDPALIGETGDKSETHGKYKGQSRYDPAEEIDEFI